MAYTIVILQRDVIPGIRSVVQEALGIVNISVSCVAILVLGVGGVRHINGVKVCEVVTIVMYKTYQNSVTLYLQRKLHLHSRIVNR